MSETSLDLALMPPVEISANSIAAFAAGRTVTYLAAGLVENIVPAYTSEITPAPLRGFFTGSLVTFLLIGNLLGAALPRAYANSLTDVRAVQKSTTRDPH